MVNGVKRILKKLKMKWISVKQRLPVANLPLLDFNGRIIEGVMISEKVLVYTKDGQYSVATINQNYDAEGNKEDTPYWFDEQSPDNGDWINDVVTHWTPLNKPE